MPDQCPDGRTGILPSARYHGGARSNVDPGEGALIEDRYDLVVIGAGPAGEKGAAQAAYYGKRVAIVERSETPGGSAVSSNGIPTKTLRETALYITGFRRRDVYGLGMTLTPQLILERLKSRTEEVVRGMVEAVQENIARNGIELIHGEARLGPDRTVLIRSPEGVERTLVAERILIATGSRPLHPPGIPFDDPDVLDSDEVFGLERLPKSIIVVGGGPVGCEYASITTALGCTVTLLDGSDRLLPFFDAELTDLLARCFRDNGIRLELGTMVSKIARVEGTLTVELADGRTVTAEVVLFAAGRRGNVEGLDLEAAGVEVDAKGRVIVDETFRTTAEGIYAAGDVVGPPALASISMEQGRVAASHAFSLRFKDIVDPAAPSGVYSIPEAAMVGLTEQAAQAEGIDFEVGRAHFARNSRARIEGDTDGMVKLVFRRDDRRLLGVHILGDDASEIVHTGQSVMHDQGTIDTFIQAAYNTPTRTEAYKYAAYDGLQRLSGHVV